MSGLLYDGRRFQFDDRLLTHLHIVVVQKLSRGEGFLMSWVKSPSVGSGRASIWLHPGIPVQFDFTSSTVPAIDRDWLQRLRAGADSSAGLIVTDEAGELAQCGGEPDPPRRRAPAVQTRTRPARWEPVSSRAEVRVH